MINKKPRKRAVKKSVKKTAKKTVKRVKRSSRNPNIDSNAKNRAKDSRLRREYGITLKEYNRILEWQVGVCYICNVAPTKTSLAVDHCHATGKIRGLLCMTCNRGISKFRDDLTRFQNCVKYFTNNPVDFALGIPVYSAPGRVGTKKRSKLLKTLRDTINLAIASRSNN